MNETANGARIFTVSDPQKSDAVNGYPRKKMYNSVKNGPYRGTTNYGEK